MYYLLFVCFVEVDKCCCVENSFLKSTYSKLIKRLLGLKSKWKKLLWGFELQAIWMKTHYSGQKMLSQYIAKCKYILKWLK
jgi:hypothetical protein